ncbi:type II secretion system F family protein [Ruficoccus amylovorans]|uniref:Type II secretion system F family protein n=1 Tax=Ruficoccus amylovorans TaxID=1804625 RepID=A0A842HH23_9BACT|nr:type II secretion system F family protein [Ruficoccus amylovorans]MBC2595823.1 type II secretion system F family protein [Ruficoccus amylovorans]
MTLSHKQLSAWYLQLRQMLEAGLLISDAVETASGPSGRERAALASRLRSGQNLDEALGQTDGWLPRADRLFLKAAALTGQLPQTLSNLAERHQRIAGTQMKCLLACLYPLAVLHLGILARAVLKLVDSQSGFQFEPVVFLKALLLPLGVLWAVIALVVFLVKTGSPAIPFVMKFLPGLRGYGAGQRMADLASALKGFVEAGLPIGESWAAAGAVTGNARLKAAGLAIREAVNRGEAPSAHLARLGCFPADFVSLYTTGERTGHLDSSLAALARRYQDQANTGLTVTMILYPMLIFLVVAGLVVVQVVGFYAGYFNQINEIMK